MDITSVITHILLVLVAAKVAAELAERAGIPAVVGEIVAGIVIGPSVLGIVGTDEVLRTLGELGVILLLLEVGLEMDLRELARVGRASLLVASVGVVVPMALGIGAMEMIGNDFNTSLFIGAALTATSVGITARVFGDLRALATTEARVVLGAAVADDVMGLVVLTVVVRLVTEGSVSVWSVLAIVGVALAFLVVGGVVGFRVSRPLFGLVERFSRSTGTMVGLAFAFTLAFARVAEAAKLAPIVGAFVAGIALTRSDQADRIRRELAPVGHLFIPVFFLQIGLDADIAVFAHGAVLRDAAILFAVAVVGKLCSPIGARGSLANKLVIGIGMIPRGEVGLIFATIGLQTGVLGRDLYGALVLVVLATTVMTPPLLKLVMSRAQSVAADLLPPVVEIPPAGGWLVVDDDGVELAARPPDDLVLPIALGAAVRVGRSRPGPVLLQWLQATLPTAKWSSRATDALLDVVERGNARSWRFLDSAGVFDGALPELAAVLRARGSDGFELDPIQAYRFDVLERLRRLDVSDPLAFECDQLGDLDRLKWAAFLADACDVTSDPLATASHIMKTIGVEPDAEIEIAALVRDRDLLWAAAHRTGGLQEEPVLQLASHFDTPERARTLYVITALRHEDSERWERQRLAELHHLIQEVLAHDELTGEQARNVIGRRRAEAIQRAGASEVVWKRLSAAPRSYISRVEAAEIVRHARLLDPIPDRREVRVEVTEAALGQWSIDVVAREREGLLSTIAGALSDAGYDITKAVVATWDDGVALDWLIVDGDVEPDADALRGAIVEAFERPRIGRPIVDAVVRFDNASSPWHTVCEVEAPDRPGLLHDLAAAFTAADVSVQSATIAGRFGLIDDRFELTDRHSHKLGAAQIERVETLIRSGTESRPRRRRHLRRQPSLLRFF